ncbi:mannose-1-phosphate guanylyltransferase/mannose-6-phosphate isomerase [Nitrincola tibetensis]|uniref:mannose-1-phosphate guanylyltransferase n=1 Tax=Nitrincola tibetensis TaxID=2219697 RepID=A0A364NMZ0_9GAMM|nr:mannose-1-phosphate guanylyltransferase/mannose-6-phosphate isomerase [Nitrincola tibetensis]RAU18394.1 mannose-1-phosphate guanylyltransferase/mannose-6-phosphate isomerase [Nitrincola tibetensis]
MIYPIILAGGQGTRLWPLSRSGYAKQFLDLTGSRLTGSGFSLLQQTLQRATCLSSTPPLLICNEEHRFIAAEQLRQLNLTQSKIILEPVGRNTAPAIALAALHATAQGHDPLLLVLAADHLIQDPLTFQNTVLSASPLAEAGHLVTFGIVPTHAETGYGYIQKGATLGEVGFKVSRFVEKPDAQTAAAYVESGEYCWNSGMFLFRASRYLDELKTSRPDILEACQAAMLDTAADLDFIRVDAQAFAACPEDSIDYAVMEKTQQAAMVPLDAGWSDIGSWSALWEVSEKDTQGNHLTGDVLTLNTHNTLVKGEKRLIATVGVEDLVIIDTQDALLVAHKDQVQDVKKIVERLKAQGRTEHLNHREVYRPWGVYDSIDNGERYQVKRITVKPGAKLSVQMHHHRAEHWIVVSGTAKVTNGDETYLVTENESTYIPIGQVHALENPGVIPLELIEVQSGSYLGEDDIVRFEDRYGRVT